jgi:hypothetical protein
VFTRLHSSRIKLVLVMLICYGFPTFKKCFMPMEDTSTCHAFLIMIFFASYEMFLKHLCSSKHKTCLQNNLPQLNCSALLWAHFNTSPFTDHSHLMTPSPSHFATDGQSVSLSVSQFVHLGVESYWDSWPDVIVLSDHYMFSCHVTLYHMIVQCCQYTFFVVLPFLSSKSQSYYLLSDHNMYKYLW